MVGVFILGVLAGLAFAVTLYLYHVPKPPYDY